METKEAIMFIEKYKRPIVEFKDRYYVGDEKERRNDNVMLDGIIALLIQGEENQHILDSLKSAKCKGNKGLESELKALIKTIEKDYIEIAKNKIKTTTAEGR